MEELAKFHKKTVVKLTGAGLYSPVGGGALKTLITLLIFSLRPVTIADFFVTFFVAASTV
jgi:hypothetical protein